MIKVYRCTGFTWFTWLLTCLQVVYMVVDLFTGCLQVVYRLFTGCLHAINFDHDFRLFGLHCLSPTLRTVESTWSHYVSFGFLTLEFDSYGESF